MGVVDDHVGVRDGVRAELAPDIDAVIATAARAGQALADARRIRSAAMALDHRQPDEDGLSFGLARCTCLE